MKMVVRNFIEYNSSSIYIFCYVICPLLVPCEGEKVDRLGHIEEIRRKLVILAWLVLKLQWKIYCSPTETFEAV